MAKEFCYLNFHTEYSSRGTTLKRMAREYCFSEIFWGNSKQHNKYVIKFYKDLYCVQKEAGNNACFMTIEELNNHINYAKRIYRFKSEVIDTENYYEVHLEINGPRIAHRFILTWVRYAYEFPFNMYLSDAYKLKRVVGFKRDDIFNLFNIVAESAGYHFHGDHIHAIGDTNWTKKFFKAGEVKKVIADAEPGCELNDLFIDTEIALKHFTDSIKGFSTDKIKDLDFWESNDIFKERTKLYKLNKKLVKK